MLEQDNESTAEVDLPVPGDLQGPAWDVEAPRGGKAVLNVGSIPTNALVNR